MEKLCDLGAEAAVLAGIFKYGDDAYYDVADFLQPMTFVDDGNQAIFKCFSHMIETQNIKKLDQVSVMTSLKELGFDWMLMNRDLDHVKSIMNRDILLDNVRRWGVKIRKLQIARQIAVQLRGAGKKIEDVTGEEAVADILGIAENPIFDFSQLLQANATNEPDLFGDGLDEYIDYLESHPVDAVGIPSPWGHYNKQIGGGFRKKTISMLGARQGVGKSLLALNIALFIAEHVGIPVLYLDTEMDRGDHWPRAISHCTYDEKIRATIDEIEQGKFGELASQKASVMKAKERLKGIPFSYMNVVGMPFENVLSVMRRWIHKSVGVDTDRHAGDCLIVYDYFKLMSSESLNSNMAEFQALGFQMTAFHNFVHRYDVPAVTFTQLNREALKETHGGTIRGSDRILDLVTNFAIFGEKSDDELSQERQDGSGQFVRGDCKIVVLKSRHGKFSPKNFVHMQKTGQYARITELNTNDNYKRQGDQPQQQEEHSDNGTDRSGL
jgi:replicative DNA helicase